MLNNGPPQYFGHFQQPPPFPLSVPHPGASLRRPPTAQRDDDDGNPHRIAHTLTACCRCRQASTSLCDFNKAHKAILEIS